jgi:hypothetical protein
MPPVLKIQRSSEWMNRARGIGVYIDGQKAGMISNGETKEFIVTPGEHLLSARIDWCGSREYSFIVAKEGTETVTLSGFAYSSYFGPIALSLSVLHFILYFCFHIDYLIWGLALLLLYLFYYLSLGRKDYLKLVENNLI